MCVSEQIFRLDGCSIALDRSGTKLCTTGMWEPMRIPELSRISQVGGRVMSVANSETRPKNESRVIVSVAV